MPPSLRSDADPAGRELRLHTYVRQNDCDKWVCIENEAEYKVLYRVVLHKFYNGYVKKWYR